MSEDLQNIKELFNSGSNQNLYMAWHMLKNHKEYARGEFVSAIKDMFYSVITKSTRSFVLQTEKPTKITLHKYIYEGKEVFSFKLNLENVVFRHKKKIPIEFMEGQERAIFHKITQFLDLKMDRI